MDEDEALIFDIHNDDKKQYGKLIVKENGECIFEKMQYEKGQTIEVYTDEKQESEDQIPNDDAESIAAVAFLKMRGYGI